MFGDVEKHEFISLLLQGELGEAVAACERQRLTAALAERMRAPLLRDEASRLIQSMS